jgi:phosphopantetheinyl transferase
LPACRFIVRRGMLRRIVSRYVDQQPQNVRFEYNPHGKPFLAPELAAGLQFNLSDSGDLAALAICLQQPVGIDIEKLRRPPVADGLESYSLTLRELGHFERVPEPERNLRFLRAWTRREAIVKAEGVGLQLLSGQPELEDFADHQEPAWEEGGVHCKRGFHLYCLALPDGYVGSLATRRKLLDIRYFSPG